MAGTTPSTPAPETTWSPAVTATTDRGHGRERHRVRWRGADVIAWNDLTGDLVNGDAGNDTIIGGNVAADTIFGGSGDDLIRAFATEAAVATAADELSGDAGDDVIQGGNAADTIEGGADDDTLSGNGGADIFVFGAAGSAGDDVVTDFSLADDTVRLVGFGGASTRWRT